MKVNRKEREYQLRRELIIDVAEQLFYQRGYENVTLTDIARAAQYTKKTLYSYITGKGELYLEVYCRGLEKRRRFINQWMQKEARGIDKIQALGVAYFGFFEQNPQVLLLVQYFDYRGIEYDKVKQEVVDKFISINKETNLEHLQAFESGISDGSIKKEIKAEIVYSQFILCLRTITHTAIWGDLGYKSKKERKMAGRKYFEYFLQFFMEGIATQPDEIKTISFSPLAED